MRTRTKSILFGLLGLFAFCLVALAQDNVVAVTNLAPLAEVAVHNKQTVQMFDLSQVRLLESPFKRAEELNRAWLLALDPDRFLYHFRFNAGVPTTAQPYGGWEAADWSFRGHTLGHYLTACAQRFANSGEEEFKRRVDAMVVGLAECQVALAPKVLHPGFLDPLPEERFAQLEAGGGGEGVPFYTMHKTLAGLLDAYTLAHNAQALEVAKGMAAWLKFRLGRMSEDQIQRMLRIEYGGMNEALANLYAITGDSDHLHLAEAFNHKLLFEPLACGEDPLGPGPGEGRLLHGNTQVPKVIGAGREFELTGNPVYATVATNFWDIVTRKRTWIFGGNTDVERFFAPGTESQHLSQSTGEGCNTYNMLKLTRQLFTWDGSAARMDFYERALYNHILAMQNPRNGLNIYFMALEPGLRKLYGTAENTFWCCTGTSMENHSKYADTIYAHTADALYVNLFIPSELDWSEKGATVRQLNHFPDEEGTTLTFSMKAPQRFALKIRYPYWSGRPNVVLNGREQPINAAPSSYITMDREWRDGDRVAVHLPMNLRVVALPDNPSLVAFMYGPLVLAGNLGREGLQFRPEEIVDNGKDPRGPRVHEETVFVPGLVTTVDNLLAHIKPVAGKRLTFVTEGIGRPTDVTLIPLNQIVDEYYTVYWRLFDDASWRNYYAEAGPKEAERKTTVARVLDAVWAGNDCMEAAHAVQPVRAPIVSSRQNLFRDATQGELTWKLKASPDVPVTLRVGFVDATNAAFDIFIGEHKIAEQRPTTAPQIDRGRGRAPHPTVVKTYNIPLYVTAGRRTVDVRFVGIPQIGSARIVFCELSRTAADTKKAP